MAGNLAQWEAKGNVDKGFRIFETSVRRLVPPKRIRSLIGKRPCPLVVVKRCKIQCTTFEGAIEPAIDRSGVVLHWDDHTIWELGSGMFQKIPVVVHKEQVKTGPYFDSSPVTRMMKSGMIRPLALIQNSNRFRTR